MNGLLFLLFNIGVVLVAHWCLRNDSTSLDGATKGLFAIATPAQAREPATKKVAPLKLRIPRLNRR